MEELTVCTYSKDQEQVWDAFVKNSKNGTFLLQRAFMEYHSDRFQDYSLLLYRGKKLLALLPANIQGQTVYTHQGLTYGGLILSHKEKYKDVFVIFKALLKYLYTKGILQLEIKEIPSIYHQYPSDEILHLLYLCKATLFRRDGLSVLNNQNAIKLTTNRKVSVKKAITNQLRIEEVTFFNTFWTDILIPNLKEKHNAAPVHSLEEITYLHQNFPENIRQFNVYQGHTIVAGTTVFESKKVAHMQYISGKKEFGKLGGLDFLYDFLIKDVFAHKDFFDFGISNEENGQKVNEGLLHWKEGFGARTITQDFYSVSTQNYTLLNTVFI